MSTGDGEGRGSESGRRVGQHRWAGTGSVAVGSLIRAERPGKGCNVWKYQILPKERYLFTAILTSARGIVFYSVEEALSTPPAPQLGCRALSRLCAVFLENISLRPWLWGYLERMLSIHAPQPVSTIQIDSRAAASAFVGIENVRHISLFNPFLAFELRPVCRTCSRIYLKRFSANISINVIHVQRGVPKETVGNLINTK